MGLERLDDIQKTINILQDELNEIKKYPCQVFVFVQEERRAYETAISAIRELQEYKTLEASGRLPKLPCAVGDTVYEIIHDDIPVRCDYIGKYKVEDVSVRGIKYAGDWLEFDELQDVYFSREEAETRLRELAVGNIVQCNNKIVNV